MLDMSYSFSAPVTVHRRNIHVPAFRKMMETSWPVYMLIISRKTIIRK